MINLLPPEIKRDIKFARYNVAVIQYCILAMVVAIVVIGLALVSKSFLSSTENELQASIDSDRAKVAELAAINDEANALASSIDTIASLLEQEVLFSQFLQEIGSVLPPGVVLTGLLLSETRTDPLAMSVAAIDPETIGVLQNNLAESDLFVGADILSVIEGSNLKGYNATGELQAIFVQAPAPPPPAEEEAEAAESGEGS